MFQYFDDWKHSKDSAVTRTNLCDETVEGTALTRVGVDLILEDARKETEHCSIDTRNSPLILSESHSAHFYKVRRHGPTALITFSCFPRWSSPSFICSRHRFARRSIDGSQIGTGTDVFIGHGFAGISFLANPSVIIFDAHCVEMACGRGRTQRAFFLLFVEILIAGKPRTGRLRENRREIHPFQETKYWILGWFTVIYSAGKGCHVNVCACWLILEGCEAFKARTSNELLDIFD